MTVQQYNKHQSVVEDNDTTPLSYTIDYGVPTPIVVPVFVSIPRHRGPDHTMCGIRGRYPWSVSPLYVNLVTPVTTLPSYQKRSVLAAS